MRRLVEVQWATVAVYNIAVVRFVVMEKALQPIKDIVLEAVKSAGYTVEKGDVFVEHPQNEQFGDYTTTIAMSIAKSQKTNPKEIAEKIAKHIPVGKDSDLIEEVKVVGGFINFKLKKEWLVNQLKQVIKEGEGFGKPKSRQKKKIIVEFGQPNTHKITHIGHLFSYTLGESIARLVETSGAEIFRANYQGDVGPHVAKCLWAFLKNNPKDPKDLADRAYLLQKMYQEGSAAYKDDPEAKSEIDELNKKIYEKDASVEKHWEETRKWSVDYYKDFEARIGTHFDRYYFESEMAPVGKKIVEENVGKVFEKSEGAIIFDGEKYGLHKRVFITKKGTPTYEAKDMGLQTVKMKEWPFDFMIITTANEQNEYFKVVIKALEELDPVFKGKIKHFGFGMVQLKTGKMSSRTGNIVGGIELVDQAVEEVRKVVEKREGLSDKEKAVIAESVGIGAIKWAFLKNNPLQNMQFDFEESISFDGNSGPYLQYTYARARSVLKEAEVKSPEKLKLGKFKEPEEEALLRTIYKFPEVVADATDNLSPNSLCTYLFDLAQKFSSFYNKHRVLQAKSEEIKNSRLLLTAATAQVIKNGLNLLGIKVLEKM